MPADWNTYSIVAICAQITLAGLLAFLEASGRFQLPMGRFRGDSGINARAALLPVNGLPILVYIYTCYQYGFPDSLYHRVLLVVFVLIFSKRCLEVSFLHRYSKGVGWIIALVLAWAYSAIARLAGKLHCEVPVTRASEPDYPILLALGLTLFLAGMALNLYHHILLARLRRNNEKQYQIPEGGLFRLIASPHYLGDCIVWIAFGILSGHLAIFGIVLIMTAYLGGRAYRTRIWYRENLPGYPNERKALLPYLF